MSIPRGSLNMPEIKVDIQMYLSKLLITKLVPIRILRSQIHFSSHRVDFNQDKREKTQIERLHSSVFYQSPETSKFKIAQHHHGWYAYLETTKILLSLLQLSICSNQTSQKCPRSCYEIFTDRQTLFIYCNGHS